MSRSHLVDLHNELSRRGWRISEFLRGDNDVLGAATWLIQRSTQEPIFRIDFAGFGPLGEEISIEESYACFLRGHPNSLYFRRVNRSRKLWRKELSDFTASLDTALESIAIPFDG